MDFLDRRDGAHGTDASDLVDRQRPPVAGPYTGNIEPIAKFVRRLYRFPRLSLLIECTVASTSH